jgi:uncharacterized protein
MSEKIVPSSSFPMQAALFEASLVFLAMFFGWLLSVSPLETAQFNARAIFRGLLAVVPLFGMLVACQRISWSPIRAVHRVMDDLIVPMFQNCTWMELAMISLLAGLGEELLFRGVFQASLREWTGVFLQHSPAGALAGDWIAIVGVAIVFGMLHAVNVAYAVLAALMGIYLGWLWMFTGNLVVPIIAHAVYDFLALGYILRWRNP